jgi:hypothetical protein
MKSIQLVLGFSMCVALTGCIGVDYVDDPIIGERIEIEQKQVAMQVGEMSQTQAIYYDQYGIQQDVEITWTSSVPAIAAVNQQGLISALSGGQTTIIATHKTAQSQVAVNVVIGVDQVASVVIASPGNQTTLKLNEMITLTSMVKNINGDLLNERSIAWVSEDTSIASVTDQGVLTGIGPGMVDVYATVEGIKSNVLAFSSGDARSGMFVATGGYKASGTASLSVVNGKLKLEFSDTFETSFALGTFIYLANSTNGSNVRSSGLEVGQITTNGAKTFDITAINPTAGLFDYKYVIILCKPATLTFGYAELK